MKNVIVLFMVFSSFLNLDAQVNSFEKKATLIAHRIDSITNTEKSILKKELKAIDKKLEKKDISREDADAEKKERASFRAKRINDAVFLEEQNLQTLIKNKVNGKLDAEQDEPKSGFMSSAFEAENFYKDSITGLKVEKRLTTQFVLALGMNSVLNDGGGFYGDGFRVNPIGFGELGFTFKYRLKENTNLWNFKFGLSMMANELRPENNNDIVVTNQNQTTIEDAGFDIIRSRFTNTYLSIPLHLELDFSKPKYNSKTDQTYLRSQTGFRVGLGGFVAFRIHTNQIIRFDEDGKRNRLFQQDDFNVNTLNFGPSAYIGYDDFSIFATYSVHPIFKNNPVDVNSLSIALRMDIN